MKPGLNISFFGSSLVSAYWNGAATYYRGIIRGLAERGHSITFYEPDAYGRQQHRDIDDPVWAKVVVYLATEDGVLQALESASQSDLLIKTSGVGVFDALLESAVAEMNSSQMLTAFWDVDAPATLDRLRRNAADPFRALVPRYDLVLTYGGGAPVVAGYKSFGARECVPIYNALDPCTHYPVAPAPRFAADVSLLANRLPDREARIENFFLSAAEKTPGLNFLLAGNGWGDKPVPANVHVMGHVFTADHNAFNCSARIVMNVSRESMARYGYSPATRVFEAAGAAACVLTDQWEGIESFFDPGSEILVARDADEVSQRAQKTSSAEAASIGAAAYRRALAQHTYSKRVDEFERVLGLSAATVRASARCESGVKSANAVRHV